MTSRNRFKPATRIWRYGIRLPLSILTFQHAFLKHVYVSKKQNERKGLGKRIALGSHVSVEYLLSCTIARIIGTLEPIKKPDIYTVYTLDGPRSIQTHTLRHSCTSRDIYHREWEDTKEVECF